MKYSICRKCFHSYVCDKFNENKDDNNQKCHFVNDHFVSTADVAEVKHGKWIREGNEKKCSVCGFVYYSNNDEWNGCPNCLAKMDGGKAE